MAESAAAAPRARVGPAVLLTVLSLVALVLGARATLLAFEPGLAGTDALLGLSLLPVLLVLGVLYGLSGKLLFTAWTGYWVLWALYLANAEKLEHLSRSLRPGDFSALPTFLQSPGLFMPYVDAGDGNLWWCWGAIALGVVLLLVEPRSLRVPWWARLGFACVCAALLVSLVRDARWGERFAPMYGQSFHLWAPEEGLVTHGLIPGLLKLSWAANVGRVRPDAAAVARFVGENAASMRGRADRAPPAVLPDLIVVQSESMFDPADLRGIDTLEAMAEFRRIAARGLSGRLEVPTFAGGTIRTEYELLTGYPLDAFPAVEYPYLGIALDTPTSLPRTLSGFGYRNVVLHPYDRAFWNREDALPALGFDAMHFYDEFLQAPVNGWYVTDTALFDRVLSLLPDDPAAPPQMLFAITMENHGPWNIARGLDAADLAAQPLPADLPDDVQLELRNYLALLASTDRALGAFADALLARKRPTLLLFYGDHLPDLGATYRTLGFDNDDKPWKQTVPYLLVGNVGYPQATLDTDSEFMASLLLDALQLPFEGYLSLNASARDSLAFAPLQQADRDYVRHTLRHAAQLDYADGGLQFDLSAAAPAAP